MSKFRIAEFLDSEEPKEFLKSFSKRELVEICKTFAVVPDGDTKKDYVEALAESRGKFVKAQSQPIKAVPVTGRRV